MTLSTEGIAGSFCFALKVKSGLKNIWFIGSTLIQTALRVTKFCSRAHSSQTVVQFTAIKKADSYFGCCCWIWSILHWKRRK